MSSRLCLWLAAASMLGCGRSTSSDCISLFGCPEADPVTPVVIDPTLPEASTPLLDASVGDAHDASVPDSALPTFGDGGLAAMCPAGGNSLYVYGDPGAATELAPTLFDAHSGSWSAEPAGESTLEIQLFLTDTSLGDAWILSFSTQEMRVPLAVQRFEHVRMMPGDNLHAGMYVEGGWHACGAIHGWFEIEELVREPDPQAPESPRLRAFTATFEQQCDDEPRVLRGCVHYETGK